MIIWWNAEDFFSESEFLLRKYFQEAKIFQHALDFQYLKFPGLHMLYTEQMFT